MKKKLLCLLLCILVVLTGCEDKTTDDVGETVGVYYDEIGENNLRYAHDMGQYAYLHYNDRMYTATEYRLEEKNEMPVDSIVGKELATVYGNNGKCWSTDGDELAGVTDEAKIYEVNGYADTFRVCIYYENYVEEIDYTFYSLFIFDCLNGIYLDKGSELFEDRLNFSESKKITTSATTSSIEFELSKDDEKLQDFIDSLYKGTFIDKKDENYPELDNINSCCLNFYDSCDLVTTIKVYDNGYVTMSTIGQSLLTVNVGTESCKSMVWPWNGTYRADITIGVDDNQYEKLNMKVEVADKDFRQVYVYVKKEVVSVNDGVQETEEILINNEAEIILDMGERVIFSMKESGFLDNAEDLKDVYVELMRESGEKIYFRYSYSKEELENAEYYRLERSEY